MKAHIKELEDIVGDRPITQDELGALRAVVGSSVKLNLSNDPVVNRLRQIVEAADATAAREDQLRALVDTGSTDCELKGRLIEQLDLRPDTDAGFALFETAAGIQTEAQIYRATIQVCGREALCLLSPAEAQAEEEDEDDEEEDGEEEEKDAAGVDEIEAAFGFEAMSDDALLGHDALAALGLAVDCSRRRLFPVPS